MARLPQDGRVSGSERYAPSLDLLRRYRPDLAEDVFELEAGGADAAVADYQQGGEPFRLVLVDYQTPQLAAAAERHLAAYYEALPPDAKQRTIVKRQGNYLIQATGVTNQDAARRVVDSIEYSYQIKWLKNDPSVPTEEALNFYEEARKTALVVANSRVDSSRRGPESIDMVRRLTLDLYKGLLEELGAVGEVPQVEVKEA